MADPATWGILFNAVRTGGTIIDEKKRSEFIQKMKWLITKRKKIVVFGISGAGKSQFINSLKKCLDIPGRTLTSDKQSHDLEEFPIVFIDTPGHSERIFERKKEITDILKTGVEGIINVVSYGYEENPDYQVGDIFDAKSNVKESFLKLNRKVEIDRLGEWLPQISPTDIRWIVNLISKADLWWDRTDEVKANYEKGDYNTAFSSIQNFTHVITLPYCSIIKPYYDKKTSGVFGEIQKANMHEVFIHQLTNLLKEK